MRVRLALPRFGLLVGVFGATVLSAESVARMDPGQVRDYLGSQGPSVDALRATNTLAERAGRELDEGLFDSDHTGEQILAELPGTPAELFTPEFLQRLRHPSGTPASALRRVDSWCDWQPDAPV